MHLSQPKVFKRSVIGWNPPCRPCKFLDILKVPPQGTVFRGKLITHKLSLDPTSSDWKPQSPGETSSGQKASYYSFPSSCVCVHLLTGCSWAAHCHIVHPDSMLLGHSFANLPTTPQTPDWNFNSIDIRVKRKTEDWKLFLIICHMTPAQKLIQLIYIFTSLSRTFTKAILFPQTAT